MRSELFLEFADGEKQVDTGQSDQNIDNSGDDAHSTKNDCDQVKTEKTNQTPIDGADNY